MNIELYDIDNNTSRIIDHEDFLSDNEYDQEVIDALETLYETRNPQLVGMGYEIRLPTPHRDDQNETCTLQPITINGAITELEIKALKGIDLAEICSEPLNRFSVARGFVRLSAIVARKVRG